MQPAATAPPIRVMVVEDDPFFVQSFTVAIAQAPDVVLQAVASSCRDALALLDTAAPAHVLLVDLGLPDGSGIEVIRRVQEAWPGCLPVVISVFGDEAHVIHSLEAGAAGYLLKDAAPQRIVEEIRTVMAGGSPISPLIARRLLRRFRGEASDSAPMPLRTTPPPGARAPATPEQVAGFATESASDHTRLSPRESTVLEYITKGFSYEEIGQLMGVSRNTVLSFVRRIYAKLKVRSQTEAIHEARTLGLLPR